MMKYLALFNLVGLLLALVIPFSFASGDYVPKIAIPEGLRIEAYLKDLQEPVMVAFDNQGRMMAAEKERVIRVDKNGKKTVLADKNTLREELPVWAVSSYENKVYLAHGGVISIIEDQNKLRRVVAGLPTRGDFGVGRMLFHRGFLFVAVGTATNSGVVGEDNRRWLTEKDRTGIHDVPCFNILLDNQSFESRSVLEGAATTVMTSPFSSYGISLPGNATIKGDNKCSGSVLRMRPDGRDAEVYAWGFRNLTGLTVNAEGEMFGLMQSPEDRGSRPVAAAPDMVYEIKAGEWYGWPDFVGEMPITDPSFKPVSGRELKSILASHPDQTPPKPAVILDPLSDPSGVAFAPGPEWGDPAEVFLALSGGQSPKIVRANLETGEVHDFLSNGAISRPSDVAFGPDGAMYIVDQGSSNFEREESGGGIIWRVFKEESKAAATNQAVSLSLWYALAIVAVLLVSTLELVRGKKPIRGVGDGFNLGLFTGFITLAVMVIVSELVLRVPWYALLKPLAAILLGDGPGISAATFDARTVFAGFSLFMFAFSVAGSLLARLIRTCDSLRSLLGGVFFGLTCWAVFHYLIFPIFLSWELQSAVNTLWLAALFAFYGLITAWLLRYFSPLCKIPVRNRRVW